MVQQHAIGLVYTRWAPDNVHNRHILAEGTSNAVDGGQLAYAKRRDHGGDAVDAGVAVGGVGWKRKREIKVGKVQIWKKPSGLKIDSLLTGVQLVAISYPCQSFFEHVIQSHEVVVSWNAKD